MKQIQIGVGADTFLLTLHPWSGQQQIFHQDQLLSTAQEQNAEAEHQFLWHARQVQIRARNRSTEGSVDVAIWIDGEPSFEQTLQEPSSTPLAKASSGGFRGWLWLGLGLKLLKTAKVLKVALVAASVSAYSILFSVEFAIALVAILIFHEYGHVRAMKSFGIPTKGMYLIPFVGGLAVGDRPTTRWQDVYISMMGPVYGLIMTIIFYVIWLITDSHFAGLVASTSALINLFNLLPVYPLDGGRVLAAIMFSSRNKIALIAFLGLSALCFYLSIKLGLALLCFFIVLGVVDIFAEWKQGSRQPMTPLALYGMIFCALWWLLTVAVFVGIILLIAEAQLPGSEIAIKILNS